MLRLHDFQGLAHPLSQILAAETVFARASAFVKDEWRDLYTDPAPDEDEVSEALNPFEVIGHLQACGLRFEFAGTPAKHLELGEDIWVTRFDGSTFDVLVRGWLCDFKDRLDVDPRVVDAGMSGTDLVLIPDPDGIIETAYAYVLDSMRRARAVEERVNGEERDAAKTYRDIPLPVAKKAAPTAKSATAGAPRRTSARKKR